MNRLSLSGQTQSVARPPYGLFVIAALLLITGAGYGVWKKSVSVPDGLPVVTAPTQVAPAPPISDDSIEDMQNHIRHIEEAVVRMQENTKRIERRLDQVSPTLEQNYLSLEKQRLDIASQLSENVLRDGAQALEELQLTRQNLTNRRQ